ncbi:MAG: sulfur carrier protein ThiS [Clostridia bacterium]|nr:sulfur carrier protein ThiS [Clostridia bacterium]
MVIVNGEAKDAAGKSLKQLLDEEGYELSRIVVERNLEIVPKESYDTIIIEDNDSIEVLSFVGGG